MADFSSLQLDEREHQKFRDAGLNTTGRRLTKLGIEVENTDANPLPVTWVDLPGDPIRPFFEISAVPTDNDTELFKYTVPVGKVLTLALIEVGGDNIAKYEVFIDGALVDRKRTYFGESLDKVFSFQNKEVAAGLELIVNVEHSRPLVGAFEAKIIGALKDE